MGLRINSNIAAQSVQKSLGQVNNSVDSELARLSSGKRINSAADDAAGLALSNRLEAQVRSLNQATRNANDGMSLIQTAEGGLSEISGILIRLRELSVQSASDTVGNTEREMMDKEYQQLTSEIDRIAQSTVYNGIHLLNGEADQDVMEFQVGAYAGNENVISFNVNDTNATTDGIGIDGLGVASKDDALDSIEALDEAINNISGQRANLGAVQNRLQTTVSSLQSQSIAQENARSLVADVDVADSAAKLAANNVKRTAATAALAQANVLPQLALRVVGE